MQDPKTDRAASFKRLVQLALSLAWLFASGDLAQAGNLLTDGLIVNGDAAFHGGVDVTPRAATAMPTNGLLLYYSFSTNDGGTVVDQSGAGHDGIVDGATWTATGWVDGAMEFDGSDDSIDVGSDPALEPSAISICLWLKTTSVARNDFLVEKTASAGSAYAVTLASTESSPENVGQIEFQFFRYGYWEKLFSTGTVNDGLWHHIVVTYADPTASIYIDGALDSSAVLGGSLPYGGTYNFYLGQYHFGAGAYFNGALDEVMIYDRVLTSEDISALAYNGAPTNSLAGQFRAVSIEASTGRFTNGIPYAGKLGDLSMGTFTNQP